jgi:hypothetical protein
MKSRNLTQRYMQPIYSIALSLFVSLFLSHVALAHKGGVSADVKAQIEKSAEANAENISFLENKGQWPAHVLYKADLPGAQMLATPQGMMVGMYDSESLHEYHEFLHREEEYRKGEITKAELGTASGVKGHGWRINFLNGNVATKESIERKGQSKEYYNFLIGDASKHATNIHGYSEIVYKNVYNGIDVRYYTADNGDFENDIIVAPGADFSKIQFTVEGIEGLRLNKKGDIVFETTVGEQTIPAPISYLIDKEGKRTPIQVHFKLLEKNTIAFVVPKYDVTQTLVIDPIVLRWATYIAGSPGSDSHFHAIDVDAAGNIFACGRYNGGLITVGAFQTTNNNSSTDLFISRYLEPASPGGSGTRVWQTYLGDTGTDNPYALTLGLDGYIYIVGPQGGNLQKTYGTGFSAGSWTQRTGSNTGFIAKVHPNGTGAAVRTLGATSGNWGVDFYDVRVLPTTGNNFDLIVVGSTTQQSASDDGDIPAAIQPDGTAVASGGDNGYALRISSNLENLIWKRQYSSSNGQDRFNICVVDNANNVIIGGYTRGTGGISYNNPSGQTTRVGNQDGWLMRLNSANGNALWSRYFNSTSGSSASILCMETNRLKTQIVIGGMAVGALSNVNTTAGAYRQSYIGSTDFFVASLPIGGNATTWGTYFGGSGTEVNMMGLNLDLNDDVYVLGYSWSKDVPVFDSPLQTNSYDGSNQDALFFKLSANGANLRHSTYIGGTQNETDPIGQRGIKFSDCRVYLPITTYSQNFPVTAGTLTNTRNNSTSRGEPVLLSMANPPDLTGNSITSGANQTITCGSAPVPITAAVPSFIFATVQRNGSNQTNGTSGAYPSGVPVINQYQWQSSIDSAATWQNIPGATSQNYTPPAIYVNGITLYRRIINGDACNRASDTLARVSILVTPSVATSVVTSNGPLCVGQNLQLTANSATPGVTYAWTGPNGFTSSQQNPTISGVTVANAGVYSVIATSANGCKSAAGTITVVVNTIPSAPTAGSNSPVCSGQTLNLTASPSGGTFSWTGPNGFASSVQNPSITNVSTAAGGTYNVTRTVNGCTSPIASTFVVVNFGAPASNTTATPNPICVGNTVQFNTASATGATYSWTGPAGFTASVQNPTRSITSTTHGGYYVVRRTVSGCISAPDSVLLVVNNNPTIASAAGTNPTTCGGTQGTVILSGLTAGQQYTVNYQRAGVGQIPQTLTANGSGQVILVGLNAGSYGNFIVTQVSTGCPSPAFAGPVTLTDPTTPATPVATSNSPVCSGDTIKLFSSTATGATYAWTGPSGFNANTQNPIRLNAVTAFGGTYSVVATVNNCNSLPGTVNVVVNQRPAVTTAVGANPTTCGGTQGTITLSGLTASVQYSVSYSRNSVLQTPVVLTSNGSGQVVLTGLNAGIYTNFVVTLVSTGCSSATFPGPVTLTDPTTPATPVATSNSPVCSSDTIKLFSSTIIGATYAWTGPSGFNANTQNPIRLNAVTAFGGTYSVVATVNNCNSLPGTVNVVVNQRPAITTAVGANPATCGGTQGTITLSGLTASVQYSVSYSRNSVLQTPVVLTSNGSGQVVLTGLNAGTYTNFVVTLVFTGCSSATFPGPVTLTDPTTPATPVATSNSPVCSSDTIKLFSSTIIGATYAWTGPSGFNASTQNPIRLNAVTAFGGTYSVVATVNNCNSLPGTVNVVVNQRPTLTGSAGVNPTTCLGNQGTITLSGLVSGTQYSVAFTRNGVSQAPQLLTANASGLVIIAGLTSGTYANFVVTLVATGCSSLSSPPQVVLTDPNPPALPLPTSNSPVCSGDTIKLFAATVTNATYTWSGPSGFSSSAQNPVRPNALVAHSGTYSVYATLDNCNSPTRTVNVVVNQRPNITTLSSSNPSTCGGTQGSITLSGLTANVAYSVTYTRNNVVQGPVNLTSNASGQVILSGLAQGAYADFVVTLVSTGCSSDTLPGPEVLSDPTTPAPPVLSSNSPVCYGDTLKIFASTIANATYAWTATAFNANTQNVVRANATPSMSGVYSVVVTVNNCNSNPATITAVVNSCPPVAVNDAYTTPEDQPLVTTVPGILVNDYDPANPQQPLTVTTTPVCNVKNGTLVLSFNGSFSYTPASNFNGLDTFCYRVCDNELPVACDTAIVVITVTPVNDPPVAVNDFYSAGNDTAINGNVRTNDFDVDGDTLIVNTTPLTNPVYGTVVLNSNGTFTYTPPLNFNLIDSFRYSVCDGSIIPPTNLCDTAWVYLDYSQVNRPPLANRDNFTVPEDSTVTYNIMVNDFDPDNDLITVQVLPVLNVSHGTLTLNGDSTFTYTPFPNYYGQDTFIYRLCDNGVPSKCDTALVVLTIVPVNDKPEVPDSTITTCEDCPISVCLPITDVDVVDLHNATICGLPVNGTITSGPTVNNASTPHTVCLTYAPRGNYHGKDSICVIVCDNGIPSLCDTGIIRINITPVNDPPVAENIKITLEEGNSQGVNVGASVSDPEGDPVVISYPNGFPVVPGVTFVPTGNGAFDVHTAVGTAPDTITFQYQACDVANYPVTPLCDTATITIVILPVNNVNDPPYANNDRQQTPKNVPAKVNVLANDGDPNGDPLAVTVIEQPKNGTATLNPDKTVKYTPNNNYVGADTFRYKICDNGTPSLCDTAYVYIDIVDEPLDVNDPPLAVNDYYVIPEDSFVNGNVLTNDSDPNGDSLIVTTTPLVNVSHGTVTLNGNGTFLYTPIPNFTGIDSFIYRVCDDGIPPLCDTATVYITVDPRNDPPVAENVTVTVEEGESFGVNVGASVGDPNGDPVVISYPNGFPVVPGVTFIPTGNGTFDVVTTVGTAPNTITFPYQACDVANYIYTPLCDTATITINIIPVNTVNDPPVASNDRANTPKNVPAKVNVLANDFDPNGDPLTVTVIEQPSNGTATVNPDKTVTYVPDSNFVGLDTFRYRICDNGTPSLCDTAYVFIDIVEDPLDVNDPPYAANDYYVIPEDSFVNGNVLTNDSDPNGDSLIVTTTPLVNPTNGTVTLNGNGTFLYTPTPTFNGVDSFIYRVCDDGVPSLCDTATVYITVEPRNDPPVAENVTVTVEEGESFGVNVGASVGDPNGDPVVISYPNGFPVVPGVTFIPTGNGTFDVVTTVGTAPNTITFPYQACDVANYIYTPLCDTATITINIIPVNTVNDPPVASNDRANTPKNIPAKVNVLANDFDPNGDPLTVTVIEQPSNGTATVNPDKTVTYVPDSNFVGLDTFRYRICDNGTPSLCDTAYVFIDIVEDPLDVNDPPYAANDYYVIPEDSFVNGNVLTNDSDPNGDSLIVTTTPLVNTTNGTVTLNGNGTFLYTPNLNFTGVDSFIYRVCDDGVPSLCDTATVYITVEPRNDPPVAENITVTIEEGESFGVNVGASVGDPNSDPVVISYPNGFPVVPGVTFIPTGNGTFDVVTTVGTATNTITFPYQACDIANYIYTPLCDTALITINIIPVNTVNDPPVANDDRANTPVNVPAKVNVLANDFDPNGDPLTVAVIEQPSNGTATVNPDKTVTYVPDSNFVGLDTFRYRICDNGSPILCDDAYVFIDIVDEPLNANDPPYAANDYYVIPEDSFVNGNVLTNDSDPNGDSLVVTTTPLVNPTNGTVTLNGNGTFLYTPNPNYNGLDTFIYRVCDDGVPSLCDTATVYITMLPGNDKPEVPDTTVTTCEDCPITVCIPITDVDTADLHSVSICGLPKHGTLTSLPVVNNGSSPHEVCYTYKPYFNFYGNDTLCLIVCDNGNPQLCDTSYTYIIVTPENDPPYADTVRVYTKTEIPVAVNTSLATGDPDGDPLTYTYATPSVPGTVVTPTGTGAIVVTPPTGFDGVITIVYSVCDAAKFPVTPLCDTSIIIVTVLPSGDSLVNHPPVANNDFAVTDKNVPAVINVKGNDFDPDGDSLSVQILTLPNNGSVVVNQNGTVTYTPNTGFIGYDTFYYQVCDPFGTTSPRPLCDDAMVVVFINEIPNQDDNNPPVAVDDLAFICQGNTADLNLLLNDSDPDGDAITFLSIIKTPTNGVATQLYYGGYRYTPSLGFVGSDTFTYRICDNGVPSLCDTANAIITVRATPVISAVPTSLSICSGEAVNIAINTTAPATITWTATNGTSGTGNVATTLVNNGLNDIVVTYTFRGVAAGGCYSNVVTVPVTVKPRPLIFTNPSANQVCAGEPVVIVLASNYNGVTFSWTTNTGKNGSGLFIIDTLTNTGVIDSTVTYTITPFLNGCPGTPALVNVVVKPRPDVTLVVADDSVCNGQQVVINATSNLPNTVFSWNNSLGQSGSSVPVLNTPLNGTLNPLNITYTVNSFNGVCAGTPKQAQVVVFPPVAADAGFDKSTPACALASVTIGGRPTAFGTAPFTYNWSPTGNLNDSAVANPQVTGLAITTIFTVTVTDVYGCTATDVVEVEVTPNTLAAEAGNGGTYCFGPGGFVQLGGLPTVVGGQPPYTYTWSPLTNLFNPSSSNPLAQPTSTVKYFVTVTDANGCTAVDSVTVIVRQAPTITVGNDTSVCNGFSVALNAVTSGGQSPYTYSWTPQFGLSGFTVPNPVATPNTNTYYQVVVTDANGCTATDDIQVSVRENPTADAGSDRTLVQCGGDSVQIGGLQSFANGIPPFKYLWTPNTGLSSDTVLNPWVKGITANTTYILTVTDSTGCAGTDNVVVLSLPNNLSAEAGNGGSLCGGIGAGIQLGGSPTATGGTPVYLYRWSPSVGLSDSTTANPIASPLVTTKYFVTVTDAKGCTAIDSTTVTINGSITVDAGQDTAICNGFAVRIGGNTTASGGAAPYSYTWTPAIGLSQNNVANPFATPNTTTNYTVLVRDVNGCTGTDVVTITVNQRPNADAGADKTHVTCAGDSVQIGGTPSATGGAGNYTYLWSPNLYFAAGSDSSNANPYVAGSAPTTLYSLLVTDTNGCTATDVVLVTATQSTLAADAGTNFIEYCQGSTPLITLGGSPAAFGGSGVYYYAWSGPQPLSPNNTVSNPTFLPIVGSNGGTYTLTVTDSKGCTATDQIVIIPNQLPLINIAPNRTICAGTTTMIGADVAGYGPLFLSWSNGVNTIIAGGTHSFNVSPLVTTTYGLTVTDAKGCTNFASVTVTVNQNPVANAGVDQVLTACAFDSVQLGGSPAASGGQTPYTYFWNPGVGMQSSVIPNPFVKNIGSTTTYTLQVVDLFGCIGTDQVVVTVNQSTLAAEAGTNAAYCKGSGTEITLGGTPTASGGTPPVIYTWFPSTGLDLSNNSNPKASPDTTTTYTVVLTDAKGCQASDTVRITVFELPVVNAGQDTTLCFNGSVRLGGSPTVTGGRAPFTYSWTPPVGIVPTNGANPVATPSGTTTYTVSVTDANGCRSTDDVVVSIAPQLTASAGQNKTVTSCAGDSVSIGGSPTAFGGTGAYKYTWLPAANLSSDTVANPVVKNLTQSTIFSVTVTDAAGCSATSFVTVQVVPSTLQANAGNDTTICFDPFAGSPVMIGGLPTAIGGTSPYIYSWSPANGLNNIAAANPLASPVLTTTYALLVTDAKGCTSVDSIRVSVNAPLNVAVGSDTTICAGDTVRLGGTPTTGSGGTSPYSYSWTPTSNMLDATTSNPRVFPTATTLYQVVVRDLRGCSATAYQEVRVNAKPVADAGPDKSIVACGNATITIGGSPTASGGSGNFTYNWTPVNGLSNQTVSNPNVSGIDSNHTYVVLVTDQFGCTNSDEVLVTVTPSSLSVEAGNNRSICTGDTSGVQLGGLPTAVGGTASYIYSWSPNNGTLSSTTVPNPIAKPLATTTYYVWVRDANGCTALDSVVVTVNQTPFVEAGADTAICFGTSLQLGGNPTAAAGQAPFTYNWSPVLGNLANPTVSPTASVVYGLTVTDAFGCSATDFVTVTVRLNPIANAGADKALVACGADSVFIGGTPSATNGNPPYSYLWSPFGDTVANPVVKNIGLTTDFTLVVTDVFGCTATDVVRVSVTPSTLTIDAGNGGAVCAGTNSTIQLGGIPTAQGGVLPYTYQWSGAGVSPTNTPNPLASPTQTTTYTVVVTDANGCQGTDTVTVVVNTKPVIDFTVDSAYCVNTQVIPLVGQPAGGTFSGTGVVGNAFFPSLTGSGTFQINYFYTDGFGCNNTISKSIKINPLPVVNITGANGPYCSNALPVDLVGTPAGGTFTGPGYSQANGQFNPGLGNIGNNTITYTYTDANGCTNTATVNIVVNQAPTLDVSVSADTICRGMSVTISPVFSSGVFNIQWYDIDGTYLQSGLSPITVQPVRTPHGYVAVATSIGSSCSANDTVFVHVNQTPVAADDMIETCEDEVAFWDVLANDSDPEGDDNSLAVNSAPANGTATVMQGGVIRYEPRPNFNGSDSFTYVICNTQCLKDCDTASVLVSVCSINDTPTITIVIDSIPEDSFIVICPPVFDADTDHLVVTPTACFGIHGTITHVTDTCFLYTPNTDWHGTDTICVVVCDPFNACDSNIVIITVTPRNEPPVADTIRVVTKKDTPIPVNVTSATFDPNGDPMDYTYGTPSVPGTGVTVTTNGGIVVTPPTGFVGQISIPYVVCDNAAYPVTPLCDTSVIIVTVIDTTTGGANNPPVANNDYASTPKGVGVTVNVFANDFDPDGDPISVVTIIDLPNNGVVSGINGGNVGYQPNPNFEGCDTLTYVITDSKGGFDTADVVICIVDNPSYSNNPPTAVNDYATTPRDNAVVIPVVNNDNDPDGNAITLQPTLPCVPLRGTVVVNQNGTVTYTPGSLANALQPDTFCYAICDNGNPSLCDTAVVVVYVPNSVVAEPDDTITGLNNPVTINVFENDYDPEKDSFCLAEIIAQPLFGSLTYTYVNGDSCRPFITYTPDSNFVGTDGFCYSVVDQWGARDTACVSINVFVCIPPQVIGDSVFMYQDTDTLIAVLDNDIDYGVSLNVSIEQQPAHGTVQVIGNKVYYKPNAGYFVMITLSTKAKEFAEAILLTSV